MRRVDLSAGAMARSNTCFLAGIFVLAALVTYNCLSIMFGHTSAQMLGRGLRSFALPLLSSTLRVAPAPTPAPAPAVPAAPFAPAPAAPTPSTSTSAETWQPPSVSQ